MPAAEAFLTVAKPFNKKLREREGLWEDTLSEFLFENNIFENSKRIWVHAASMGEFEQAKPLIEEIKSRRGDIAVISSFFSPSGFNNQKNYKHSDGTLYMPLDTRANAKYFISSIKPDLAVFVRYEYWLNHLSELKKRNIPSILVCASEPNNPALKKYFFLRAFMRTAASSFEQIFTVGEEHSKYFRSLNSKLNIVTSSDTRFDRIAEKVQSARQNPILPRELFEPDEFVLVAGSCWEPDEAMIASAVKMIHSAGLGKIRVVFVPHEPKKSHLDGLRKIYPDIALLSEVEHKLESGDSLNSARRWFAGRHIAVDSIGKLLRLYSCADAAHIGGGFGAGVHSVTEPAGYGIPLSCGAKFENSPDAIALNKNGALAVNKNPEQMFIWLKMLLSSQSEMGRIGDTAREYIRSGIGASKMIADSIIKYIR